MEESKQKPEQKQTKALDTDALAQSLKSLAFFLGGTHVAGLVEEAEKAAWEGKVVNYE